MISFEWSVAPDRERPEGQIHTAELADSWIIVQQVTVIDGVFEWGWLLCADPGEPGAPNVVIAMRNGFETAAMAKLHAENYVGGHSRSDG